MHITWRCPQLVCVRASTSDPDSASTSTSDRVLDAAVQVAQRSGGTLFSPEVL